MLRILRSRTSLFSSNVEELLSAEFYEEGQPIRPEFEDGLSTYEVGAHQYPQAIAEHKAAARNDPPRVTGVVDVTALKYTVTRDDPRGPFSFINSVHRLLDVEPAQAGLQRLAAEIWNLLQAQAGAEVPAERMQAHVRARVEAGDEEWATFLEHASDKWLKFAGLPKRKP
jgi:hypothetical protein